MHVAIAARTHGRATFCRKKHNKIVLNSLDLFVNLLGSKSVDFSVRIVAYCTLIIIMRLLRIIDRRPYIYVRLHTFKHGGSCKMTGCITLS